MAEELITGTNVDEGQPDTGSDGSQTTDDGSQLDSGQPDTVEPTTPQGPDTSQEDTFFDPRDVADDPKLNAAYKNMQRAYTKKMQGIADQKQKIEAYDAFYQNPLEQIQRVAQQYGYQLTNQQAQNIAQQAQVQPQQNEPWQPQSWEEVSTRIEQLADQKAQEYIQQKMGPVMNQVQTMRKESIESQLAEIDPTWQQYEDDMKTVLQTHPTLANDPSKLYRLSVPQDVLESRATQAALRKMETRQSSAQVSGKSTTPKSPQTGLPDKPVSFAEAVDAAKKALAEQGIRPGE